MARRNSVHTLVRSRRVPAVPMGAPHAVHVPEVGAMLWISGQLPLSGPRGKLETGPMKKQAEVALRNLAWVLQDSQFGIDTLVRMQISLVSLEHLAEVQQAVQRFFVGMAMPTISVVQVVALPQEAQICIEGTAVQAKVAEEPQEDEGDGYY